MHVIQHSFCDKENVTIVQYRHRMKGGVSTALCTSYTWLTSIQELAETNKHLQGPEQEKGNCNLITESRKQQGAMMSMEYTVRHIDRKCSKDR